MIWHPLVWAFWAAALTGSVLYAAAAVYALDVAVNDRPERADSRQLEVERRAEAAVLMGKWALGSFGATVLIGLIGITRVWHAIVPGAMCGTGVLQAMGANGGRALLFWSGGLAILYGWRVLVRLDDASPEKSMLDLGMRLLLTVAPLLVLALVHSWQALMHIDAAPPVSCCAAVYDRVLIDANDATRQIWFSRLSRYISLAGTVFLPAGALLSLKSRPQLPAGAVAVLAIVWSLASAGAVKHVWSAYYYQVLSHPCPWCLFLPDHHGVGFLIFGCLAVVVLESLALWAARHAGCHHAHLAEPSTRRARTATIRMMFAILLFTLLTVGPALVWRLRYGVWLDGSA